MYRQAGKYKEVTLTGLLVPLLCGGLLASFAPSLPGVPTLVIFLIATVGLLLLNRAWAYAAAAFGFCWFALAGSQALEQRWPVSRWNEDAIGEFRILDFLTESSTSIRFDVAPVGAPDLPSRIRVAWYRSGLRPQPGDHWQLKLRLRAPRGLVNYAGFDYARWLLASGTGATAYVVEDSANRLLAPAERYSIAALRIHLVRIMESTVPEGAARGVLIALSVGSRHALEPATRDALIRSGTYHLMAISGLHIGLAAGMAMLLVRMVAEIFSRTAAAGRVRLAQVVAGIAFASLYAAAAGFSLPTQRALIMLIIGLPAWALAREVSAPRIISLALAGVFLFSPLSLLSVAFHLSFAAVLILCFLAARDRATGVTRMAKRLRFIRWQLGMSLLSVPINVLFFGRVSLLGPVANLLCIPWFSLIVVPLLFAGLLLSNFQIGLWLLGLCHRAVGVALWLLENAVLAPWASTTFTRPDAVSWVAAIALCGALLWTGSGRARMASIGLLLCLALPQAERVPESCVRMRVFDVGQGQAVLLQTARDNYLYDTGPGFGGTSAAASAIIPSLHALGVTTLSAVIVSHSDADHAGGLDDILNEFAESDVFYSGPTDRYPANSVPCADGLSWSSAGVEFSFLHPARAEGKGNDASCVLRVRSGPHAILLTGDIERGAERALLDRHASELSSEIAFVAHHGSETSSTEAFVNATSARFAIVSSGFKNRWSFPRQPVLERWQSTGAIVQNTALTGMLSATVCPERIDGPYALREQQPRFWRDRPSNPGE